MSYKDLIDYMWGHNDASEAEGIPRFSKLYTHGETNFIDDFFTIYTARHMHVLRHRFELQGKELKTLAELGNDLLVSASRVRGIEQNAIRRLRHPRYSMAIRQNLRLWKYNELLKLKQIEDLEKAKKDLINRIESLQINLDELDMTVRLRNSLKNQGIESVAELFSCSAAELLRIPGLGRRTLNEVKEIKQDITLHLKMLRIEK